MRLLSCIVRLRALTCCFCFVHSPLHLRVLLSRESLSNRQLSMHLLYCWCTFLTPLLCYISLLILIASFSMLSFPFHILAVAACSRTSFEVDQEANGKLHLYRIRKNCEWNKKFHVIDCEGINLRKALDALPLNWEKPSQNTGVQTHTRCGKAMRIVVTCISSHRRAVIQTLLYSISCTQIWIRTARHCREIVRWLIARKKHSSSELGLQRTFSSYFYIDRSQA